MDGFHV